MENKSDVIRLLKLSTPRHFKQGEYICYEGDPGEEMYIILKGQAGVYISSAAQEEIPIAKIGEGEFFGEMALFEKQERSASCVAEEDTTCIAINRYNLKEFIISCPEITEKLIAGLSERIRRMDDTLYKTRYAKKTNTEIPFIIPSMHKDCDFIDKSSSGHIRKVKMICPVCGAGFQAESLRLTKETSFKILPNQRKIYEEVDPLWHSIRSCNYCGYSNYYVNFLKLPDVEKNLLEKVLLEEKKGLSANGNNHFKILSGQYYRAIHFNQCFNEEDSLLLGKLWLYLGWIYSDAGQENMQIYCHEKALEYYTETFTERQYLFVNEYEKTQCAMLIAELYFEKNEVQKAKEYYHKLTDCQNKRLAQQAADRIFEIRNKG